MRDFASESTVWAVSEDSSAGSLKPSEAVASPLFSGSVCSLPELIAGALAVLSIVACRNGSAVSADVAPSSLGITASLPTAGSALKSRSGTPAIPAGALEAGSSWTASAGTARDLARSC